MSDRIRECLRVDGPQTTREIGERLGLAPPDRGPISTFCSYGLRRGTVAREEHEDGTVKWRLVEP